MCKILKKYLFLVLLAGWACDTSTKLGRSDVGRADSTAVASIIAVLDTTDSADLRSYYQLANGRKVGEDSIYASEAIFDCESEGKIRFRDRVTDKVGFFDNNGRIVIPAVYNDASPFVNGMAMAIKGAKRVGWDGEDCEKGDCEHFYWQGGSSLLINDQNQVLVDNFEMEGYPVVNWYSARVKDTPADTALYCSVKGVNGKWYVFMDYQKEFDKWFLGEFLALLEDDRKLREFVHDSLVSLVPGNHDWERVSGAEFIRTHSSQLKAKLRPIRALKVKFSANTEDLNPYSHTGGSFQPFFGDCGVANSARYPGFNVMSTFKDDRGKIGYQEHYSFLRTDKGYKLIGVTWRRR